MTEPSLLKTLFRGEIPESLLFPYPELAPREIDAVHRKLEAARAFFAASVDSVAIDQAAAIPENVMEGLRELGLFGLLVPEAYGGTGLTMSGYARVMEELSGLDASIAVVVGAHQSIGLQAILLFGTEEQKQAFLPDLACGRKIAAFALSELGAGSDAASVLTRAEKVEGGYRITGEKAWTTNGAVADVFTVFARTGSEGDGRKPRITAFIVERSYGVTIGPDAPKLGIRGVTTPTVSFNNVFVPDSAVLGEPGRGFKVAMEVLNAGRVGLAAGCVGAAKYALRLAVDRARERRAFGRPIGEFGLIKDKVATMMAETYALESATYLTTGLIDARIPDIALESAVCKVFGSETLWHVVGETLQIAAGAGYMREHPYERMLRDSRIHLIFEGTNEILRSFIALSGVQGPGDTMNDVRKAMREPMRGLGTLGDFALRKARTALGRDGLTKAHPALAREAALVDAYVGELARASERALRKHGRNIGEMQYAQRRLADMAIDLYALAAVVARTSREVERHGVEAARRKLNLTAIFAGIAERRLEANVAAFDSNDDELRKSVASRAYDDGGYALDIL